MHAGRGRGLPGHDNGEARQVGLPCRQMGVAQCLLGQIVVLKAQRSAALALLQDHPDPARSRWQKLVWPGSGQDGLARARSPVPAELQPPGRVDFGKCPHGRTRESIQRRDQSGLVQYR